MSVRCWEVVKSSGFPTKADGFCLGFEGCPLIQFDFLTSTQLSSNFFVGKSRQVAITLSYQGVAIETEKHLMPRGQNTQIWKKSSLIWGTKERQSIQICRIYWKNKEDPKKDPLLLPDRNLHWLEMLVLSPPKKLSLLEKATSTVMYSIQVFLISFGDVFSKGKTSG